MEKKVDFKVERSELQVKVEIREPEPFAARLMRLDPAGVGVRRPTTWQQANHKRFNAYGCQ